MYKQALFIFRRDLRLEDNTGLLKALESSKKVIACFILDPNILGSNHHKSPHRLAFLRNCLEELHEELKKKGSQLYVFEGKPEEIVETLILEGADAVFVNKDYTPRSMSRDAKLQELCAEKDVPFVQTMDCVLNGPESVLKGDGKPYTVFTPYYRTAKEHPVKAPKKNTYQNYHGGTITGADIASLQKLGGKQETLLQGGRAEAKKLLEGFCERVAEYKQDRDIPSKQGTSLLSAHHKFGTVSMREVYHALIKESQSEPFIRQLYWHDFFAQIGFHFPHVYEKSFNPKYENVHWENDEQMFTAWKEGKTGFPIVDAGMRELNESGYMHNRLRMITASFLTKDLHIDWRKGEVYFAQQLIDFDTAVNNGSWQWAASTGCDAQPYFRIFNPWLQQKRFDPSCEYIKKWVPELKNLDAKHIHKLADEFPKELEGKYPKPIVEHSEEREKALMYYKES